MHIYLVHHSNLFHYQCYYYVACNTTGDIRLRDGADSFEGQIEICYNQAWGTVCHDFWSTTDANVACGQLGFRNTGKFVIICVSSKKNIIIDSYVSSQLLKSLII